MRGSKKGGDDTTDGTSKKRKRSSPQSADDKKTTPKKATSKKSNNTKANTTTPTSSEIRTTSKLSSTGSTVDDHDSDNTDIAFRKRLELKDPHSFANINVVRVRDMLLAVEVNFTSFVWVGSVVLTMEVIGDEMIEVVLDTFDLTIKNVSLKLSSQGPSTPPVPVLFKADGRHPELGTALRIQLPVVQKKGDTFQLAIEYSTSPAAPGLVWLAAPQTEAKRCPFLYTHFSYIGARSAFPCQDTPSVKSVFKAKITVPKPLRALMSAICVSRDAGSGQAFTYHFDQRLPVPTHLVTCVVGDLIFKDITTQNRLWGERGQLDRAPADFGTKLGAFLSAAEEYMGIPYEWGRYDSVIMPSCFPYACLDSPALSLMSPSAFADENEFLLTLAHAVSCSWLGHVVNCKTWRDAWLHNSFSLFLERKLIGRKVSTDLTDVLIILGRTEWEKQIDTLEPEATRLMPDLKDTSPGNGLGPAQFERGFAFLCYLEHKVGESAFRAFLKEYITTFKHQSINTYDFKQYFQSQFSNPSVSMDVWLNGTDIPAELPPVGTKLSNQVDVLVSKWITTRGAECSASDISGWSSYQIVLFLQKLRAAVRTTPLPENVIEQVGSVYGLADAVNLECRFEYLRLGVASGVTSVYEGLINFLKEQSQLRLLLPLYSEWFNSDMGHMAALSTFAKYRDMYLQSTQQAITRELESPPKENTGRASMKTAHVQSMPASEASSTNGSTEATNDGSDSNSNNNNTSSSTRPAKRRKQSSTSAPDEPPAMKTEPVPEAVAATVTLPALDVSSTEKNKEQPEKERDNMDTAEGEAEAEGGEGEAEEEEEEEEAAYREPILDGRVIKFHTHILNEFLLCTLCMGYFRDAHTIRECLHTFCKSCLYKYFQTTADCPVCGQDLRPNPHEFIRFDRNMHNIVNKLFGHIMEKDLRNEAEFYRMNGLISDAERIEAELAAQERKTPRPLGSTAAASAASAAAVPSTIATTKSKPARDLSKPLYRDEISFELLKDESETGLSELVRPLVRTTAQVTVRHLKKFLSNKLPSVSNINDLDVIYKGEVLGMEHSMEYILKTRGFDLHSAIQFKYRKRRTQM
eukprot:TRINITY_DN6270_c0_g1_i1.p1 TRINITY_DN6270_c0_g1~~TRINITY_DN6270_c0_g1_i1.p1  ORF type:complete len:1087 (-),score=199.02 TRINITY_DN6270_c0_g1_i1:33-3293(-)